MRGISKLKPIIWLRPELLKCNTLHGSTQLTTVNRIILCMLRDPLKKYVLLPGETLVYVKQNQDAKTVFGRKQEGELNGHDDYVYVTQNYGTT